MDIFVTRHGKTVWNTEERLQGKQNSPLVEDGIIRAKKLGEKLKDYNLDKIYTSPLLRAAQTANYINEYCKLPIEEVAELKEMSFGQWEGKKIQWVMENHAEEFEAWQKCPEKYQSKCGGESFVELVERVKKGLDYITSQPQKRILIVTHGIVVKAIQQICDEKPISQINSYPVITGCSLIHYRKEKGKYEKLAQDSEYDFIPM